MAEPLSVTFFPGRVTVEASWGATLVEVARQAGITIPTGCGGVGRCGSCRVVIADAPEPEAVERELLSEEALAKGIRLACVQRVKQPLEVNVSLSSSLLGRQILAADTDNFGEPNPLVRKVFVQMPFPPKTKPEGDAKQLSQALDGLKVPAAIRRGLRARLMACGFRVTAVLNPELVEIEEGNTGESAFGLALDLGTSTIVGSLVDLRDGLPRRVASLVNPQAARAEDVIGRISQAATPEGRAELQALARQGINEVVRQLEADGGEPANKIYDVTIAGNTVMQHLLLGVDPSSLGRAPYTPAIEGPQNRLAGDLGLAVHPRANVYCLPSLSGFVGGDALAVALAGSLIHAEKPLLAVDFGTNGEILLGTGDGRLLATACAVGPAFEGGGISCGMPASPGAVERVGRAEGGAISLTTIGGGQPRGLCGSGLIDLLALLVRESVVKPDGAFASREELGAQHPLAARLVEVDDQPAFQVYPAPDQAGSFPLLLTQADVRVLQQAKGAVLAGIQLVLKEASLSADHLGALAVCGAFGNSLRPENAAAIGLIPASLQGRIRFLGNAALAGARLTLVNVDSRLECERIVQAARAINLADRPDFTETYAAAMRLGEVADLS